MHPLFTKQKLSQLYANKMSFFDIANYYGCSLHKISYWMKKFGIQARSRSDALYVKLNPDGDPFKIKYNLTDEEKFLFGLGLGIYWGEGNKASPHSVRVANTDPSLIRAFRTFLRSICQINENKIHYSIVCFKDTEPKIATDHWTRELRVEAKEFGKIVQIKSQGKGTYLKKSAFGVCTLTVSNIKLKRWIMAQIDLAKSPDSSAVERQLGKLEAEGSTPSLGSKKVINRGRR